MANETIPGGGVKTKEFRFHPAGGLGELFAIRAGMPVDEAIELARCCTSTAHELASEATSNGSADANITFAIQVLTEITKACLFSVPYLGKEVPA